MILRKDWIYLNLGELLYISISNPKKTMNKLKGIFKPLKRYFKFSNDKWAPYPILWVSKPSFIHIVFSDVMWKNKYDTPRYECAPYIWIHLFNLNFIWYWELPKSYYFTKYDTIDDYWEQALWYLYFYNTYSQGLLSKPDIIKAKESWPWQDYDTKLSSWNNKFLINGRN